MKKLSIILVFLSFVALKAQTFEELIAKGDSLTEKAFNDKAALEVYLQAEKMNADSWELQWRLSRSYSNIAAHMNPDNEDAQLATYETALKHAEKAVKLAPDKSVPYLRRSIVNGRIALFKGVFSVGDIVTSVRDDCLKSLKLNNGSTYDMALTHYILARTHAKLSEKWKPALSVLGLGWAEIDTAIVHYKKAISMYDGYIMFYLDYAKALIREDEEDLAKELLNKLLTFKVQEQDDPKRIKEAKELLKELE
ncbi:MAG: tetratricopeptide repeat protein [Ignavibacteria bacterium]|nr:MAG: tetratricopeptide repeat protein [Ignavibacteria bacterium]